MLIVPVAAHGAGFGVGHDALVLVGILALARFAIAAAAWDTGNGFALMGAARDLMIAVFGEALLVLAILVAAIPVHSTDLRTMSAGAAGWQIWSGPTHWCGAVAFALVILVETGRQPIDNPDTHLELTMIHEGPLLEYAGRDLAFLHWAAAARHWVVLVLGAELFLPHPRAFGAGRGRPRARGRRPLRRARADRDARGEDAHAPRPGAPRRRLRDRARRSGPLDRGARDVSDGLVSVVLILGIAIIVVRRRTVAIGLLASQSLALGVGALTLAGTHSSGYLAAGLVLVTKAVVVPLLLYWLIRRTREPRLVVAAQGPLVRLSVAVALAIGAGVLMPRLGSGEVHTERAAVALVLVGIAIVVMRRPALFQLLGLIVAENGVALLAVSVPGGLSYVVELGALFDLAVVVAVAAAFADRIHAEFGTGDTDLLRGLRG